MREKNINKYRESIEGEPVSLKEKHFKEKVPISEVEPPFVKTSEDELSETLLKGRGLDSLEKAGSKKQSVDKIEQEVKLKKIKPVETAKPKVPADGLFLRTLKKGKEALYNEKVKEIKELSDEEQIKALQNLASEEDPDFAAGVAKELENPFVLDEFHDKLNRLKLIEEGKLEEV